MQSTEQYRKLFLSYLKEKSTTKEPQNLYAPISYILELGGKRIRPILALMAAGIFGTDSKKALDAAMAIEVFHNFSLVHDDIMDDAPLRRGKTTVHEKWDINTGILSGDAMLIEAYRYIENYNATTFKKLTQLFSKTALQVCEGQQYDIDFETRDDVTILEYLKMIEYKTAVLVACALKMGAIIADASEENQNKIYEFGLNLGVAFQLQDDYLDTFGDPETFGKQGGGDIIENKKTYLYLKAYKEATKESKESLEQLFSIQPNNPTDKISSVKSIYTETKADIYTKKTIEEYTRKAFAVLDSLDIDANKKELLKSFGRDLMQRDV